MAYVQTTTRLNRVGKKLGGGVGVLYGTCNVTEYHATLLEIKEITYYFKGKAPIVVCDPQSDAGYRFEWNVSSKAFKAYYGESGIDALTGVITDADTAAATGQKIYVMPQGMHQPVANPVLAVESSASGLVQDGNVADMAAANALKVYVVVDEIDFLPSYQLGHLESVTNSNADVNATIKSGNEVITIFDDNAAASNGVVVRIVDGGQWEATVGNAKDILVPVSSGKFIHINHATTGSTPELYFDDDAAQTYDMLLTEAVDNNDEPYKLFVNPAATEFTQVAPGDTGIRLASLITVGPKPFTYQVGSGGPEISIAARPDAASLPGATLLWAQTAGAGLQAANYGGEDLFVPTSDGEFVKIAYNASPSGSDAKQVYSFLAGATDDLTLQAIMADDANESFTTETTKGWKHGSSAASTEVSNGVDVGLVNYIAFGPMT